MQREIAVAHQCADAHTSIWKLLDASEREPGHIDQLRRSLHIILHQIDQIRSAAEKLRVRIARLGTDSLFNAGCSKVLKGSHAGLFILPRACVMAARIPL